MNEQTSQKGQPGEDPRTTAVLILVAIREAGTHLGKLLRLARTEVRGNLRVLALLVLLFGGALLLVLTALVLFLIALRDAVAALIGNDALAAVIVAMPFASAAAILTYLGVRWMSLRAPEA